MKKLVVFLADPMNVYFRKGEIKERYYNPENFFDEIHLISFCDVDMEAEKIQVVAGKAVLFIHPVGGSPKVRFIKYFKKIYKLLVEICPDVIRAYDPSLRGALAVFFGRKLRIPVVVSIHSEFDRQRKFDKRALLQLRRILENYAIKNADTVICVTEYVAKYALRHKAKNTVVIYNSVSLDKFMNSEIKNSGNNQINTGENKIILSVGRLEGPKRHDILIRAIKNNNLNLVIIGDGALKRELINLTSRLGIESKIDFMGFLPNEDLYSYYFSCDIFAIATDFEGFCTPVIEAMAAGKPIVASDIPAIREVIGGAGILVNNSEYAFYQAFKLLTSDKSLCDELAEKSKNRVKIFDTAFKEEKERKVYSDLLKL